MEPGRIGCGRGGLRERKHVVALVMGVEILEANIHFILIIRIRNDILRIAISHGILCVQILIITITLGYFIYIIKPLESLVLNNWVTCRSLDWSLKMTKL